MEVDVETGKISLQQKTYLMKILEYFEMIDYKYASISMTSGVENSLFSSDHQAD